MFGTITKKFLQKGARRDFVVISSVVGESLSILQSSENLEKISSFSSENAVVTSCRMSESYPDEDLIFVPIVELTEDGAKTDDDNDNDGESDQG